MGLYEFGRRGIVEDFICRQPNPARIRRELEQFYEQVVPIRNVRINEQFLMLPGAVFLTSDLCWIWLKTEPNKLFGITIGKLSRLFIWGTDGQCGNIVLGDEKNGKEVFTYLFDRLPNVYFSENIENAEREKLYSRWYQERNYHWFWQQGRQQHTKR